MKICDYLLKKDQNFPKVDNKIESNNLNLTLSGEKTKKKFKSVCQTVLQNEAQNELGSGSYNYCANIPDICNLKVYLRISGCNNGSFDSRCGFLTKIGANFNRC